MNKRIDCKSMFRKFVEKTLSISMAIGIALGAGGTVVACQPKTPVEPEKPGITTPVEPEKPGTVDPGNNPSEDLGTEAPGKDPDTETPDPETPDSEKPDPEKPDTPVTRPIAIDTVEKLVEYRAKTAYDKFEELFLDGIVKNCISRYAETSDIANIEWEIMGNNDSGEIETLTARILFNATKYSSSYYVCSVNLSSKMDVIDIATGKDISINATYNKDYSSTGYSNDNNTKYRPVAQKVIEKLGGQVASDDIIMFTIGNPTPGDTQLVDSRKITVLHATNDVVKEYNMIIKSASEVEDLINYIESNQYYTSGDAVVTGPATVGIEINKTYTDKEIPTETVQQSRTKVTRILTVAAMKKSIKTWKRS